MSLFHEIPSDNARKPAKDVVAAHLVNLAWNGLANLETKPSLRTSR